MRNPLIFEPYILCFSQLRKISGSFKFARKFYKTPVKV